MPSFPYLLKGNDSGLLTRLGITPGTWKVPETCCCDCNNSIAPSSHHFSELSQPRKGIFQKLQGTSSLSVDGATTALTVEEDLCLGNSGHLDLPLPWSSLSPVVIVGSPNPPLHLLGLNPSFCPLPGQLSWAVPTMGHLFERTVTSWPLLL